MEDEYLLALHVELIWNIIYRTIKKQAILTTATNNLDETE